MAESKFPRPYQDNVPKENAEPMMEYVDFARMGIGARSSGLPQGGVNGVKSLEHVGNSATGGNSKRRWGGK